MKCIHNDIIRRFTGKARSKKGSYIAEATVVLPIIILVLITVVLVIMFFYSQTMLRCNLHMGLSCEAGEATGSHRYASDTGSALTCSDIWEQDIKKTGKLNNAKVSGDSDIAMINSGLLENTGAKNISGYHYAVTGSEYARYIMLLNDMRNR